MYLAQDTRITDTASLQILANNLLGQMDLMIVRTKVRIIDYRGDTQYGVGYDIESIAVGDTCMLIDPSSPSISPSLWDEAKWDLGYWDFNPGAAIDQVAVITGLTYGFDYVDLELALLQPNQDKELLALMGKFQDFTMGQNG